MGIALKHRKRGEIYKLNSAEISTDYGVQNDFRGKPGDRQVTLLSSASWQSACMEVGQSLDWTARRANLLIEGLDLQNTTGCKVRIGSAELVITGETDPCARMDETYSGLRKALTPEWRGGVTCKVIKSGVVKLGDQAEFL